VPPHPLRRPLPHQSLDGPAKPTPAEIAFVQWENLRELLVSLGHRVDVLAPVPGLPDMVFAANGAIVIDGEALVARFRHEKRAGESQYYLDWFREHGFDAVVQSARRNEGEGDYLVTERMVLAGNGRRTDRRANIDAHELFGRPVIALELADPRFHHLDTALAVLDGDEIVYYPPAFPGQSRSAARCSRKRSSPTSRTRKRSASTRSPRPARTAPRSRDRTHPPVARTRFRAHRCRPVGAVESRCQRQMLHTRTASGTCRPPVMRPRPPYDARTRREDPRWKTSFLGERHD
jgi:hypothetical protein